VRSPGEQRAKGIARNISAGELDRVETAGRKKKARKPKDRPVALWDQDGSQTKKKLTKRHNSNYSGQDQTEQKQAIQQI
jgi:hypothetical protein